MIGQGYVSGVVNPSPTPSLEGRGFLGFVSGEGDLLCDDLQNTIRIAQHIIVPEADHAVAVGLDHFGAPGVGATNRVLPTVEFDGEAQSPASEVDDEITDLVLAGEFFSAELARAQVRPQALFRVRRIVPQLAREAGQSLSRHSRTPIPNPLALRASSASPQGKGLSVAKLS